ncbi:hypothetical protein [Nocardia brevicatena]|uniref:hypothetical protein n=1 Tax=Nocardia brevicatena TaxID=37327 RepID=UPI0002E791D6|nr:hypothetical protein [Nocardia brevicatena]
MVVERVLFYEPGGRWRTVCYGPMLCLLILLLELATGGRPHWFALAFCAVLIAGFVVVQVIAARTHVGVELTETTLRNGTETLPVSSIAAVLPPTAELRPGEGSWEDARVLGELSGVPRRRTGIGLRRTDGALVRTWARDHRDLRAALTTLVEASTVDTSEKPIEERGEDR